MDFNKQFFFDLWTKKYRSSLMATIPLTERIHAELKTHEYKNTQAMHHVSFREFLLAQDAVKKYIQERGLILYGGTAIDYALRLRGDKIYEDNDLPDFDFWSPTYIETATEILNILTALLPGTNVYAFRAKYIRTMRISAGDNNWVADITYLPPELYSYVPTLIFDGMRIVHPHFQFVDLHSSLTFPYDGAPREVVFARWTKDIDRFNKLFAAYPLPDTPNVTLPNQVVPVSREIVSHSIFTGFVAYSLYYNVIKDLLPSAAPVPMIPAANNPRVDTENIIVEVPFNVVEIVAHKDIIKTYTPAIHPRRFAPFMDLFDASATVSLSELTTLTVFTTFGHLTGYNSFTIDGYHIRAIGIQGLLKFFLANYLRAKYFSYSIQGQPVISANVYLRYYLACLKMIEISRGTPVASFFDPSVIVFGSSPVPLHDMISLFLDTSRILGDFDASRCEAKHLPMQRETESSQTSCHDISQIVFPPQKIKKQRSDEPSKPFDYNSSPFLRISGEELVGTWN